MTMPWEDAKAAQAATQPTAQTMPWEDAKAAQAPSDGWQDTPYGFKVKPIQIGNVQTVQRDDGAAYFGPDQGNKGAPGWFNAQGQRVGDAPGQPIGLNAWAANQLQQADAQRAALPLAGQLVPPPISGMAKGVLDLVTKPARFLAHATGYGIPTADAVDAGIQQGYEKNWQQSKLGEMVGQTFPLLAIGGGGSAAESAVADTLTAAQKIKAALWGISKSTAIGGAATAALSSHPEGQTDADYLKQSWGDTKTGMAFGGALGVAGEAIGGIASKLSRPLAPEAQAVQDLGDKFGVRTLAPDLAPNAPGMNKAAVLAESIPGSGMVDQRIAQQAEARAAAEKLLAQHGIDADASTQIQQGLKNQLATGKANASAAYDQVSQLAAGKGDVPLTDTLAAIQKAKAQETSAVVPDQGLVGLLDKMESRLADPAVDTSYTGTRGLRSDLGSMISDYYKGTNAATGSKGVQVLQGIKGALESDMGKFTEQNGPELAQAAKQADSIYKNQVVPFKDRALAQAVKTSEPDQIYGAMIQQGKGDRAQKFYNALDPNGQAAVRSQMVQNAFNNATVKDGVFSPAEFAKSLEKIKDSTGVFFKGQDKMELDGFTNLMRHIQRAGQVNENPPTDQRVLIGLLTGEAAHGVGSMLGHGPEAAATALAAGGATVGSARALTNLFSSQIGKSLLLGASDIAPGSSAMENLIAQKLPRILAVTSAKPSSAMAPAFASRPSTSNIEIAQTEQK